MVLKIILGFFAMMAVIIFFIEFRVVKKTTITLPIKKDTFENVLSFYNNNHCIKVGEGYDTCFSVNNETYFKRNRICINNVFITMSFPEFIKYDAFFRGLVGVEKTSTLTIFKNWASLSS